MHAITDASKRKSVHQPIRTESSTAATTQATRLENTQTSMGPVEDVRARSSFGGHSTGEGSTLERFVEGGPRSAPEPAVLPGIAQSTATHDLGSGVERSEFSKEAAIYSGLVEANLISQRGPNRGSHTATRETAISSLNFVDSRGFFGGASVVEADIVPRHTVIDRGVIGGQMTEQQNPGVLGEAVRVRLERGDDGVYRAQAPANHALFVTSSDSGYARQILEDILISIHGRDGTEDSAHGARYGLLSS